MLEKCLFAAKIILLSRTSVKTELK